jgi:serine/threonine protein kinase
MRSPGGLATDVAIKILRSDLGLRDNAVLRLRDEGRLLARVNHPTIVRVYDLVVLDGRVCLVMEYVEGTDLCDIAPGEEPLSVRAVVQVVGAIGGALAAAFRAPGPNGGALELVHRDIKPTNIRIGRHGEAKLLDFGIARSDAMDREARTDSNLVVGSLPYMAPERFMERGVRAASDVFGLGCSLYEVLAGERFYAAGSMRDVSTLALDAGRFERFLGQRLNALPAPVPNDVRDLLHDLLGYEPDGRPLADELAVRCERIDDTLPGRTLRSWCRRYSWPVRSSMRGALEGLILAEAPLALGLEAPAERPPSDARGPQLQAAACVTIDPALSPAPAPVHAASSAPPARQPPGALPPRSTPLPVRPASLPPPLATRLRALPSRPLRTPQPQRARPARRGPLALALALGSLAVVALTAVVLLVSVGFLWAFVVAWAPR